MRALVEFSPSYQKPLRLAFAQHAPSVLFTAFLLDGGAMFRFAVFAVAAHWAAIITVMLRPSSFADRVRPWLDPRRLCSCGGRRACHWRIAGKDSTVTK